jgi:hypothetical protein
MTRYSFNQPVTSPQYAHLRQPHWQADFNISLCDNVLAFSAQLDATLPSVSGSTAAVLTYTSAISGSYTNIDEGMVCIVSPTSDPRYPTAVRLRVRMDGVANVVADGTHVYVNEYSDILGLGSYIFVYYSYDLIDSLSRPTGVSPNVVQLEDYNQPFQTLAPVIRGADDTPLQMGYADYATAGTYDIDFDISGTLSPQSGATTASYLFTVVPTGSGVATVLSGDPATAVVSYSFTPGEYILRVDVADSLGVKWFRHVLIKSHDDTYPPQEGFEGVEVQRDIVQGPSLRVKYYDGVDTLLNGTWAIAWMKELYSEEDFSDSSASLFGNIAFVGWIETEEDQFVTDAVYSLYTEVQFEVQGVGARLARIEGQLLAITNAATPTLWDQIKNLTPWRAVVHFLQRHTQALHLCDFTSDDLTDAFLFPTITTIAGNGLENVSGEQGIAWQVRSALAFARDGRILMETRADFDPTYSSDLTHVATWTDEDVVGQVSLKLNQYVQMGFINADGASWDGTSASPVPCLSRAPGLAQSSGVDQGQFNNQILTSGQIPAAAQSELNGYAGTQYAIDNNTTELTVTHPDGYWWLETSFSQLYIFDLEFAVRGITLDGNTYWMLKSVSQQFDNKAGAGAVQAVYIPVVSGFPGTTVPIINNTALTPPPIIPAIPAFDFELPETTIPDPGLASSPTTPPTTDHSGQIVLEVSADGTALSITQNYILLAAPVWRSYTPVPLPTGYTLVHACFDQLNSVSGAVSVYALANNFTDSIIFHHMNVFDASQSWVQTASPVTGVYNVIRATETPGTVMIYAVADTANTSTNITYNTYGSGPSSATVGQTVTMTSALDTAATPHRQVLDVSFSSAPAIVSIVASGSYVAYINGVDDWWDYANWAAVVFSSGPGFAGEKPETDIPKHIQLGRLALAGDQSSVFTVDVKIEAVRGGGSSEVAASTDYGVTIGSPQTVGTTPGAAFGGFDVARASAVSVAASNNEIDKATSLGGAYSSLASLSNNPTCLILPYYRIGSNTTSQTTSSTPDVVFGLDGATGGSCIGYVKGSDSSIHYITNPVSGATVPGPDCITMLRGTKMAAIFNVSGQNKLYVTENLAAGGACTWTFVENVGPTATLRGRRNDPRTGSHKGQIYVFDTPSGYSSKWGSAGEFDRVSPTADILIGDILG